MDYSFLCAKVLHATDFHQTTFYPCFLNPLDNEITHDGSIHSWGTKKGKKGLKDFLDHFFTNNIYMKQT